LSLQLKTSRSFGNHMYRRVVIVRAVQKEHASEETLLRATEVTYRP
jgi:hypothetical protein